MSLLKWLSKILVALLVSNPCWSMNWDLGLGTGLITGNVTSQNAETSVDRTFGFAGIPVSLSLFNSLGSSIEFSYGGHFIYDTVSSQIGRMGIDASVRYHFIGGARRATKDFPDLEIVVKYPSSMSLVLESSFVNYSSSSDIPGERLEGSAFSISAGLGYRFETFSSQALDIKGLITLLDLPMGSERISGRLISTQATWRVLF